MHQHKFTEQLQTNVSVDRKALRPKSSVMSARTYKSPSGNDRHAHSPLQNEDSQVLYKNEANRKYFSHSHSNSQHKEKVIDYKII